MEPIRQDQRKSSGLAVPIGRLFPLVDPGEAMPPTFRRLADRSHHGGRLQPVECCLEAIVVAHAGARPTISYGVAAIRRDVFRPASRASTICEAAQIRTSASQIVAMPCSGTASTRMVTNPARKSIGVTRLDFAKEK